MASPITIPAPTLTGGVDQSFFIEPLGGSSQPGSYLDRFPDQVYTKAPDSNLVALLYAIMGPAGLGWLLREYLQARLEVEDAGLSTVDLDALYTDPFGFARLIEETYDFDPSGLLTASQQEQIAQSDASYRSRALDFLAAARAGGTLLGVTLAAQSGAGRPVEVVENYRALYDQFTDDPLDLPYVGATLSTEEVVVVPRNDRPTSALQTLTVRVVNDVDPLLPPANPGAFPTAGSFTLTLPIGAAYQEPLGQTTLLVGSMTAGSGALTLSAPATFAQPRMQVVVAGAGSSGALVSTVLRVDPTDTILSLTDGATTTVTGAQVTLTDPITTVPLPWDVEADQVRGALESLAVIGQGNVRVTGGPFPSVPLEVAFTGDLADTPLPALIVNGALSDSLGDTFVVSTTVDEVGVDADGETATIAPADLHYLYAAVDRIKPVTTIVTTALGTGATRRRVARSIYSASECAQVLRFVTGRTAVSWPPIDSTHWVEAAVEHQAPRVVGDTQHHYQRFHDVASVVAYTEAALLDPGYGVDSSILALYPNEHQGQYTLYQQTLFPVLAGVADRQAASLAPAPQPNLSTIGSIAGGTLLIDGVYPLDYQDLPGVSTPSTPAAWGSLERLAGAEYLEVDLGSVQVVNYLSFEATQKPYDVGVAYDLLDMAPARTFRAVTIPPTSTAASTTSIGHDVTQANPWAAVSIYLTNALGAPIYTRFLRIGFIKRVGESSFTLPSEQQLPFSVEVRNLRVGRNVS